MTLRRSVPLLFAALAACRAVPTQCGTADTFATTGGPVDDGGPDDRSSLSLLPDPPGAAPLNEVTFSGILPPSWHVGESWEVMFCTANADWTRDGRYDTTRVLFKVVAVPRPGLHASAITVKEQLFPRTKWIDEVSTVNGVLVGRGANHVIFGERREVVMRFDGERFNFIPPRIQRYRQPETDLYETIGEHLATSGIDDFTPHIPRGFRNPELTEPTEAHFQIRRTLTPTTDGLVYQAEEGTDSIVRRTVFWRRGESWWSYARADVIASSMDAGDGEYRAPDGNTSFAWAIKLPAGEPASLDCNSKH